MSEQSEGNEVGGFDRLPYLKTMHNSSLVSHRSQHTGVLHRPAPLTQAFYRSERQSGLGNSTPLSEQVFTGR